MNTVQDKLIVDLKKDIEAATIRRDKEQKIIDETEAVIRKLEEQPQGEGTEAVIPTTEKSAEKQTGVPGTLAPIAPTLAGVGVRNDE